MSLFFAGAFFGISIEANDPGVKMYAAIGCMAFYAIHLIEIFCKRG